MPSRRLFPLAHQWLFLHEGLGSVALWKDFPDRFRRANGLHGLVFSRYGYGRSTARPLDQPLTGDFMHYEATEVLPPLFARLGIHRPWLFGHSGGASIALLYVAYHGADLSGIVLAAPHIMVEEARSSRCMASSAWWRTRSY